jgi:hypothetical protein
MPKIRLIACLAIAAVAALSTAACARTESSVDSQSVDSFVNAVTTNVDYDYEPLASPAAAVAKADLIIEGTLTEVNAGIAFSFPNQAETARWASRYLTLVITVDQVVSGDPTQVRNGKVFVAVLKNNTTNVGQLPLPTPRPKVVAVLANYTTWTPAPGVQVIRPATLPASALLFAPYTDGIWLQGTGDATMRGFGADRADLPAAWGQPNTVAAFVAALRQAAQAR